MGRPFAVVSVLHGGPKNGFARSPKPEPLPGTDSICGTASDMPDALSAYEHGGSSSVASTLTFATGAPPCDGCMRLPFKDLTPSAFTDLLVRIAVVKYAAPTALGKPGYVANAFTSFMQRHFAESMLLDGYDLEVCARAYLSVAVPVAGYARGGQLHRKNQRSPALPVTCKSAPALLLAPPFKTVSCQPQSVISLAPSKDTCCTGTLTCMCHAPCSSLPQPLSCRFLRDPG